MRKTQAEAGYEAEPSVYDSGPEPTPYEVWVSDDPQATWDDPDLTGSADRQAEPEPTEYWPELPNWADLPEPEAGQ